MLLPCSPWLRIIGHFKCKGLVVHKSELMALQQEPEVTRGKEKYQKLLVEYAVVCSVIVTKLPAEKSQWLPNSIHPPLKHDLHSKI